MFDKKLLKNIHQDAIKVLEEVGVKCTSKKVIDLFEETGLAAYDETNKHIHILPQLIDQTLNYVPKREKFFIKENSFGIGGTSPFLYDDKTKELIMPEFEHLKKIAQIANNTDVIDFMARGVLIPKQEVKVMDTIIEFCNKPIYIAAITDEGINRAYEIHKKRGKITIQFSIVNSPLNVIDSMIDPFIKCVKKGIPIYVSTMPMAGLSAPYSMTGLVTLTHAEGLFGMTLAQLINQGITVVHAGLPSIANIQKNYSVDLGLETHNIANLLMEKVNNELNIPSIQTSCTTSQEHPNEISNQEARFGFILMKKYGFHQMRHAFGFLKELVSFSIDKLYTNIDICRQTTANDEIIIENVNYDPDGFDAIARNSSNANYMRDDHTLKNTGLEFLK